MEIYKINCNLNFIVIGYTDVESLFVIREVLIDSTVMDQFIANPHLYAPQSFNLNRQTQQAEINEVATTFRRIYFNGANPSQAVRFNWTQYMSDAHFAFGSDRVTRYHSERQTQPVYYYKFSIDAGLNMVKRLLLLSDYDGAVHADDIFYLFDVSSWPSEYCICEIANGEFQYLFYFRFQCPFFQGTLH